MSSALAAAPVPLPAADSSGWSDIGLWLIAFILLLVIAFILVRWIRERGR